MIAVRKIDKSAETARNEVAPAQPSLARRVSKVVAAVGMALVWLMLLSPLDIGGPVGIVWVSGTSMEPGLHTGDLVITYQRASYQVDDIVAFEIPEGGVVIHRIIEVTPEDLYVFQGDNRAHADPWALPADAILGELVIDIPKAARVAGFLTQPIALAAMVTAIAALALFPTPAAAVPHYQSKY